MNEYNLTMIAVTGANGFIGTNLLAALNRRGREDLIAVDRAHPPRYLRDVVVSEWVDANEFCDWLSQRGTTLEAVYHLGAFSSTSVTDRDAVWANNVGYTQMLWRWCAQAAVPLVYASSAGTYGDGTLGFDDEIDPAVFQPLSLYAESKQSFDLWALGQDQAPPRWAGIKYFNVYGPYEQHKGPQASMAYHWFNQVRKTGVARLFRSHRTSVADGQQQRDFVYVEDAVDATIHLMQGAGVTNGLYNVGTGRSSSFADLARAVFAALGREPRLEYFDMPESLRAQYQYFTEATTTKLRRSGYASAFCGVEEAMRRYVGRLQGHVGALT